MDLYILFIIIYCIYIVLASQLLEIKCKVIVLYLNEQKSEHLPEEKGPSLQKKLNYLLMTILGCQMKGSHSLLITFIQKSCVFHISYKSLTCIDASIALKDKHINYCQRNMDGKMALIAQPRLYY